MRSLRWLLATVLIPIPALAAAQQRGALVKVEQSLTLRKAPSGSATALDQILPFTPVEILERQDTKWAKVKTPQDKIGWVLASPYLSPGVFVSVRPDQVNVRRGPGTQYEVIIKYGKNVPLRVLDVAGNGWLKVKDYDGDPGWIHPSMVKLDPPYVITRQPMCNIRKGPGTENDLVFTAERGVLLQVLEEKDGWLHVKHAEGDEGWISAKIVFGWFDADQPSSGDDDAADVKSAPKPEKATKTTAKKSSETTAKKSGAKSRKKK